MAEFRIAFEKTSLIEGGYVNNPSDGGGETFRGISRKSFPSWEGWPMIDARKEGLFPENLKGLPQLDELVFSLYKKEFWDKIQGDYLLNQEIANELYDSAVNFGYIRAGFFLQDALNLLNKNGTLFPDLLTDGKIGPRTIAITNDFEYPGALLKAMNGFQFIKYVNICEHDRRQEIFFLGWLKRV